MDTGGKSGAGAGASSRRGWGTIEIKETHMSGHLVLMLELLCPMFQPVVDIMQDYCMDKAGQWTLDRAGI